MGQNLYCRKNSCCYKRKFVTPVSDDVIIFDLVSSNSEMSTPQYITLDHSLNYEFYANLNYRQIMNSLYLKHHIF